MEPGFCMTTLVFAVAVLHLINKTIAYVSRFLAASGRTSNEPRKGSVQRDDWYMFFHRSDLLGKLEVKHEIRRKNTSITSSSTKKQKKRDPRPALRRHFI